MLQLSSLPTKNKINKSFAEEMVIYKNVEVPQMENLRTEFGARSFFFHFIINLPSNSLSFSAIIVLCHLVLIIYLSRHYVHPQINSQK